jgi:hypothetical protein
VTHVIFHEGLYSVYEKAVEQNAHLINLTWIEKCKEANILVPEKDFPVKCKEFYEDPNFKKPYQV